MYSKELGGVKLTEEQLERLVQLAADTAVTRYEEMRDAEHKRLRKKLKNNTIKLLRHYNKLQTYIDNAIEDSDKAGELWLDELLADMFDDKGAVNVKVIIQSKERTYIMMRHINNMLAIYREQCVIKGNSYYECITKKYIEGKSDVEIGKELNTSDRNVRRWADHGIEELSILMWGIAGVNIPMQ